MLNWTQAQNGNWNGKRGPYTLMTISFHEGDSWWVHPKLPGVKSVKVVTPFDGQVKAERLFKEWLAVING